MSNRQAIQLASAIQELVGRDIEIDVEFQSGGTQFALCAKDAAALDAARELMYEGFRTRMSEDFVRKLTDAGARTGEVGNTEITTELKQAGLELNSETGHVMVVYCNLTREDIQRELSKGLPQVHGERHK